MNRRFGTLVTLVASLALLALESPLVAQHRSARRSRYIVKDLGTFGGPHSGVNFNSVVMNSRGVAVGGASTAVPDPICSFDEPHCFYMHAFKWRDGALEDLGVLAGGNNSYAISINERGWVAGISENGLVDSAFGPAFVATLWNKDGQILDLGTLGGSFSLPNSINDRGQLAGGAENSTPDPDDLGGALIGLPSPTLWHAALWQDGAIQDLGTLGDGPASFALFVNEHGQVAGVSYTDSVPNPETGVPTMHPFLWANGQMTDLGGLGGVVASVGGLNNRGQVTGQSSVNRDGTVWHGFLWDGGSLVDLGTLGGTYSSGNWIDDSGEVVGGATTNDDAELRAVRWKHGRITNLGSLYGDQCSFALNSNSRGQIVGTSTDCEETVHPFLWENGGPMVDLNTLIPSDSGLLLHEAAFINERGEIACVAFTPDGETHAALLIPRQSGLDDDTSGIAMPDQADAAVASGPTSVIRRSLTRQTLAKLHDRIARRHAGLRAGPLK